MTKRDREEFRQKIGYEPCFRAWGGALTGTHVCEREQGHDGDCRCGCGELHKVPSA